MSSVQASKNCPNDPIISNHQNRSQQPSSKLSRWALDCFGIFPNSKLYSDTNLTFRNFFVQIKHDWSSSKYRTRIRGSIIKRRIPTPEKQQWFDCMPDLPECNGKVSVNYQLMGISCTATLCTNNHSQPIRLILFANADRPPEYLVTLAEPNFNASVSE